MSSGWNVWFYSIKKALVFGYFKCWVKQRLICVFYFFAWQITLELFDFKKSFTKKFHLMKSFCSCVLTNKTETRNENENEKAWYKTILLKIPLFISRRSFVHSICSIFFFQRKPTDFDRFTEAKKQILTIASLSYRKH